MTEEETHTCNMMIELGNKLSKDDSIDNFSIVEGMMYAIAAYAHHTVTTHQRGMWLPYDHKEVIDRFDEILRETIKERVEKPATVQ